MEQSNNVRSLEAKKDFYWYGILEEQGIEVGDSFWYDQNFVENKTSSLPYKLKKKIAVDAARMRFRLGIDSELAPIGKKRKHGKGLGKVLGRKKLQGDEPGSIGGISGAVSAAAWIRRKVLYRH